MNGAILRSTGNGVRVFQNNHIGQGTAMLGISQSTPTQTTKVIEYIDLYIYTAGNINSFMVYRIQNG